MKKFLKIILFIFSLIALIYTIYHFTFFKHQKFIEEPINDTVEDVSSGYSGQVFKLKTKKEFLGFGIGYDNSYNIFKGDSISKKPNSKIITIYRKENNQWKYIYTFKTF